MRTQKTLINSIVLVAQELLTIVLAFINRRLFVEHLSMEYLGYTTLFAEILVWVTFVDTGFSSIMSYRLYQAEANGDKQEIRRVLSQFRVIVRLLLVSMTSLGILATFGLPYILKDPPASWSLLYKVYWLQLAGTLMTYAFSAERILFLAKQEQYRCTSVDMLVKICVQLGQLIMMWKFQSFIGYLAVAAIGNLLANIGIHCMAKRSYSDVSCPLQHVSITKEKKLWKDVVNAFGSNVATIVYYATDSIIISRFCGIFDVARYGTYSVLCQHTMSLGFSKIMNGFQGSIGTLVYDKKSIAEQYKLFSQIEFVGYVLLSIITTGYICCFQPAICLWMGETSLLPQSFVLALTAAKYLEGIFEAVYLYREAFGNYEKDRNMMFLSAILNVVLSLVLVKKMGIVGVLIGTIIGYIPIVIGRARIVVRDFLKLEGAAYIKKHIIWFLITIIQWICAYWVCRFLPITWLGLVGKGLLSVGVSITIIFLCFHKTDEFEALAQRLFALCVRR